MSENEGIINSRPLFPLTMDPGFNEPLTPNHLLLLRDNPIPPPGIFDEKKSYGTRRWAQSQYLAQQFWSRWIKEFLSDSALRQKWFKSQPNMQKNDLVYVQVFPLKPAPLCKLFAGLYNTNKSATSLLFSNYLTLVLHSPPSFLLPQSFWQKLSSLSPALSGDNGSPDTRFSRGTTRLMSWPDVERYLRPLQFLVVSLLFYLSYPLLSFLGLEAYCLI